MAVAENMKSPSRTLANGSEDPSFYFLSPWRMAGNGALSAVRQWGETGAASPLRGREADRSEIASLVGLTLRVWGAFARCTQIGKLRFILFPEPIELLLVQEASSRQI